MNREEAKKIFLNRGYVKANVGRVFDGNLWRQSLVVISEWLKEQGVCEDDEVKKTGQWIPVSERLPNLDDYTGSEVWQKEVLITGYLSFDNTKKPFVSEAFVKDVICGRVHDTIVTAWMPLPKPYKAESDE